MSNNPECAELSRTLSQAPNSLTGAQQRHCDGCSPCRAERDLAVQVVSGLKQLGRFNKEQAATVDLCGPLMTTLARPAPARLRAKFKFAFAAVLATLVFALWSWKSNHAKHSNDSYAAIETTGALVVANGEQREIAGSARIASPFSLATADSHRAKIAFEKQNFALGAHSSISVMDSQHLQLHLGSVDIQGQGPILTTTTIFPHAVFITEGHTSIESQEPKSEMKLLKRHKIIAASAVLAVAVYSGRAFLQSRNGKTQQINAPGGAYIDSEGKTHAFPLVADPALVETSDALATPENGVTSLQQGEETFAPTGAFWDEDKNVVQFRIRGEIFDADSGHPLDGFHLQAELLDSKDFGQVVGNSIRKSFSDLHDGSFVVEGLGLGSWRITAKREGYAPVAQTLDISSLDATPYLVIPLSGGATLTGRVIDWRGNPVAGATIGLTDCVDRPDTKTEVPTKEEGCSLTRSDSSGNFLLEKLPEEETYSLYAKHKRYGYATSKNLRSSLEDEGTGKHITIKLSGRVKVSGTVLRGSESSPVAGAVLASGDSSATTDSSGNYSMLVALEENPEAHIVSYPGFTVDNAITSYPNDRSAPPLQWVDADSHAAELRIDFHIEMSNATLSGRITNANGKPIVGIVLRLLNTNGWAQDRSHQTFPTKATTDAKGNYQIEHIPAEAGYLLVYRESETEPWQQLGYVNIPDQSPVVADFQLAGAGIRGRFVDADSGQAMAISQADCSRFGAQRKDAPNVFSMAQCYPDGRFEFTGLQKGSYILKSKVERQNDSVNFVEQTIKLSASERRTDVRYTVQGDAAISWNFRILSETGSFIGGPYIRYLVGNTNNTANLQVGDEGIASIQLSESIDEIFLEAPGYSSGSIHLSTKDAAKIHEIRLKKTDSE